jgi:hypothetical protein
VRAAPLHQPDALEAQWLKEARERLDNRELHLRSVPYPGGGRLLSIWDRARSGAPYLVRELLTSQRRPRRPHERDIWELQRRAGRVFVGKKEITTNGRKGASQQIMTEVEDHNEGVKEKTRAPLRARAKEQAYHRTMWYTENHRTHALDGSMLPKGKK